MKIFYNILFVALLAVTAGCQKKEAPMQKKSHSKKTESSHKKSATKKKPCAKKSIEQQDGVMIQRAGGKNANNRASTQYSPIHRRYYL